MKLFTLDSSISKEEFKTFIGSEANSKFYSKALDKYFENPSKPIWCWPSFFVGVFWLMYRKAVLPSVVLFIITAAITLLPLPFLLSEILSFLMLVLIGMFGTNLYLSYANNEILKIKNSDILLDDSSKTFEISKLGGTSFLYTFLFYIIQGMFFSLFI